ncbi:hypothetical protein ACGFJC_53000 [Nonomuraea fuscirosea]|uniref:hypothetical protein n=1 Tax=Nonomuraea fuscirosea TaxID=1291556 RepID=UPI003412B92D
MTRPPRTSPRDGFQKTNLRAIAATAGVSAGLSNPEEYRLQLRYMLRAIEEDTPAAAAFVNALVDESEEIPQAGIADGTVRPSADVRALAVLSVLNSVAALTMPLALVRALGYERFGPHVLRRLALPTLELYTHGLYTDAAALKAARATLEI